MNNQSKINDSPLSAQEWWDFAPWNYDLNSAPIMIAMLIKFDDGQVLQAYQHTNGLSGLPGGRKKIGAVAWLPLPEFKPNEVE